jgi:hypothetical protein
MAQPQEVCAPTRAALVRSRERLEERLNRSPRVLGTRMTRYPRTGLTSVPCFMGGCFGIVSVAATPRGADDYSKLIVAGST